MTDATRTHDAVDPDARAPISVATSRVQAGNAPLLAAYALWSGHPWNPRALATLTIVPPRRSSIPG